MVQQTMKAFVKHTIKRVTHTFMTLPLVDLAKLVPPPPLPLPRPLPLSKGARDGVVDVDVVMVVMQVVEMLVLMVVVEVWCVLFVLFMHTVCVCVCVSFSTMPHIAPTFISQVGLPAAVVKTRIVEMIAAKEIFAEISADDMVTFLEVRCL